MSVFIELCNNWFLSLICLAVVALIPTVYFYLKQSTNKLVFLDPSVFKELPLVDKKVLSYNTRLFRCIKPHFQSIQLYSLVLLVY